MTQGRRKAANLGVAGDGDRVRFCWGRVSAAGGEKEIRMKQAEAAFQRSRVYALLSHAFGEPAEEDRKSVV